MIPAEAIDTEKIVRDILDWVRVESPTHYTAGVDRMMDLASVELRAMGGGIERIPGRDGFGGIAIARFAGAGGLESPGILVLSHCDTIHPVGTLATTLPIRRDGDKLYGPGVYDMKGGIRIAMEALRLVLQRNAGPRLPITFMLVPDEEVGSPFSRNQIETEAQRHAHVLVTEPCKAGVVVTGRHAFQRFWMTVHGRPAHAGANNRDGRSAIRAMAELIGRLEAMTDFDRGMTFSVGTIEGGTFVNVMPIKCRAQVLTVAPTAEIFDEVARRMDGLAGEEDGVRIEVERGPVRPLWQPHAATLALHETARAIAAEIGFPLPHGSFGGGSDGNFTGALGVATLDGLGVDGAGAHTFGEHLLVSSIAPRCRLFGTLLERLR